MKLTHVKFSCGKDDTIITVVQVRYKTMMHQEGGGTRFVGRLEQGTRTDTNSFWLLPEIGLVGLQT
jgi:hypothetical protein